MIMSAQGKRQANIRPQAASLALMGISKMQKSKMIWKQYQEI